MEIQYTAMAATLPSLVSWSKKSSNRCVFEEIPAYWQDNDAITFLADIAMYDAAMYQALDTAETEQERRLKSVYFKKRFAVSRSVLHHILHHIPWTKNNDNVVLTREKNGRVSVKNRPDIFISLSYSGPCIAITVGKRKIGSDIEMVRPMVSKKIRSIPLFAGLTGGNGKDHNQQLLHIWTVLEAYAKFHDMSLYPLIKDRFLLHGTHFVSYLIDQRFILSLASGSGALNDTLLWIDPACTPASSRFIQQAAHLSPLHNGDTHVRA